MCFWHMLHAQGRDAHLCLLAFIFMSLLHKTKMRDWYLLKDEMRTCAFSLSIFMSLLYKTRNDRLVVTQGRDVHLCLLAFYLHVVLIHNYRSKTGSCSGTCASGICCTHRDQMRTSAFSIVIFMSLLHKTKVRDW